MWFISYSSQDRPIVTRIHQRLSDEKISTFLDNVNLTFGLSWFDEIEAALKQAEGAVIFLGPGGLGTIQRRELQFALLRQARAETVGQPVFPVIPVLLPGYDLKQLPGFAALNTWVEIADPDQPKELVHALSANGRRTVVPSPSPICPFRALNNFREEDAALYFGREREAAKLLQLVRDRSLTAAVGPSGSGKSSLVQAGLMPLLRMERPPASTWEAVVATPGKRPFYSLAAALCRLWLPADATVAAVVGEAETISRQILDGTTQLTSYVQEAIKNLDRADKLLIVVDQFEELFTYSPDDLQQKFVQSILACVEESACHILLTLRADYYGRLIELSTNLSDKLEGAQLNVGTLSRDQLRQVISGPSNASGITFESGLVDRILDDVEKQPGSLPLLEFALTELWNKAAGGMFLHRDYEQIGKIAGAISVRAEDILRKLSRDQQERAPALLTRLVRIYSTAVEGANSRYILPLSEIDAAGRPILEEFAKARLLVFSGERDGSGSVEVAHEALIRNWATLQNWIDADLQFLLWRQRLAVFVSEWERTDRDSGALLNGALLTEAKKWRRNRGQLLSPKEAEFIQAGARREAGTRVWRWAVAAIVVSGIVAAGGYYWWKNTPDYQIHAVLADAPVGDAFHASRFDDDPYWQTIQGWIHVLVTTGRASRAEKDVTLMDGSSGCAGAILTSEERKAGLERGSQDLERIIANRGGDSYTFECLAGLDLTAQEKELLAGKIYAYRSVETEAYPSARDELQVAHSLLLLGDARAAERITKAIDDALQINDRDQRGQLLLQAIRRSGPALTPEKTNAILAKFQGTDGYYAENIRMELEAQKATASDINGFIRKMSTPGWQNGTFDASVAAAVGGILARSIRDSGVDKAMILAETRRIAEPFRRDSFSGEAEAAILLPVASQLIAMGSRSEALALANEALDAAARIGDEDRRSRVFAELATIMASAGRLAEAKSVADRCRRSLDRLRAYTSIVAAGGGT